MPPIRVRQAEEANCLASGGGGDRGPAERQPKRLPKRLAAQAMAALIFDKLAAVFNDDMPTESTLADVSLLESSLQFASRQPRSSTNGRLPPRPGGMAGPLGGVFVHSRRHQETIPSFGAPPRCGVATIDAEFDRRGEHLLREMRQAYSDFSLSGLAWAEERVQTAAAIRAERAVEDAEIARLRFQEDAERGAVREQQDTERAEEGTLAEGRWCSERDMAEGALAMEWKTKWTELTAALEERVAAQQAQLALDEQRAREEEARVRQEAAAAAAAAAAEATQGAEALEAARHEAELSRLRSSCVPSIASLSLVPAALVPASLGYCGGTAASGLRKDDRSWWKCLHFLEAEGLTPPLKGTEVGNALFDALDVDADGLLPLAEAGYALAILGGGSARQRVDAACSSAGAPAGGAQVSQAQAAAQLELCAKVRLHCGPIVRAHHLKAAGGVITSQPEPPYVPNTAELKAQLAQLFASDASLPPERFRGWAATSCPALFAPLL